MTVDLPQPTVEKLVTLWGRWWNELIFNDDRPGPSSEWAEKKAFDVAASRTGYSVDEVSDYISDIYQGAVWGPREAMYGGAHRRGLGS